MKYCNHLFRYSRLKTREIQIGHLSMGGENPIRIQSMNNTLTLDTESSVAQAKRIADAGADFVRLTAPGTKDAENLKEIKQQLVKNGYSIPLIADIHFQPQAAVIAAQYVEKVRINPGNFVDKRALFEKVEFTDNEYKLELSRIHQKMKPLLEVCKKRKVALRIGSNHGSLSDRILTRFGDTPEGMVESVIEFLRICRKENFHNLVISLKASNTRVMIYAYRLMVNKMLAENMDYPLHLGVTEAGEGEDGRIKSAVGIGALLADGIGDTIRVSLTEEPEFEIPVARKLVDYFYERQYHEYIKPVDIEPKSPFVYEKRESFEILNIGGQKNPIVMLKTENFFQANLENIGFTLKNNQYIKTDRAADAIIMDNMPNFQIPKGLEIFVCFEKYKKANQIYPYLTLKEFLRENILEDEKILVEINHLDTTEVNLQKIKYAKNAILIFHSTNKNHLAETRAFLYMLWKYEIKNPIIFKNHYQEHELEDFQLKSAADLGVLFIDGYGDGIMLCNNHKTNTLTPPQIIETSLGILQASRVRVFKTEYISCPGCGRTLFNLQETTAQVRQKTKHLKGLKIAVMGCIVNGPGEMADADYGYVGSGIGKINLYKGQTLVKKNILQSHAVSQLIDLIKQNGDWTEE